MEYVFINQKISVRVWTLSSEREKGEAGWRLPARQQGYKIKKRPPEATVFEWAQRGMIPRPSDYESAALTN